MYLDRTDKLSQGQSVNYLRCLFSQTPPTPARPADCWNVQYSQESATLPVYASGTGSPVCGPPESLPVWWCWRHRGTPRSVSWWCLRMSAVQSFVWRNPPLHSLDSPLNKKNRCLYYRYRSELIHIIVKIDFKRLDKNKYEINIKTSFFNYLFLPVIGLFSIWQTDSLFLINLHCNYI